MKQCVQFPDDKFLAIRPCLVAICGGNRPAGKLLGILLYRYNLRIEHREDAKTHNDIKISQGQTPDQDISFSIYRKQWQLVDDLCGELTEKTIHNIAIPWLQLLGYLDIEEFQGGNRYDVNLEQVKQALSLYEPEKEEQSQLEKFLIAHLQIEKFLIDLQLEKFPIDKKLFLLALEKVLIANRKISNCQRGRKPRLEVPLEGESEVPQNLEEDSKKEKEEGAHAPASVLDFETRGKRITAGRLNIVATTEMVSHIANDAIGNEQPHEYTYAKLALRNLQLEKEIAEMERQEVERNIVNLTIEDEQPTEKLAAIKATSQQTTTSGAAQDDAAPATAASPQSSSSGSRASGLIITHAPTSPPMKQGKFSLKEDEPVVKVETPAQILKRQERRRDEYLKIYGEEIGRKPSRSKDNLDGAMLCAQDEVPEEDFRKTIKAILADDYLAKNLSVAFIYKKLDAFARKSTAPPAPPRQVNNLNGAAARLAARRAAGG